VSSLNAFAAYAVAKSQAPAGGLTASEVSYNFGRLVGAQASRATHEFHLRNTTSRAIAITKTQTSCGCTVATLSHKIVLPQQDIAVVVKADWAGRTGPQAAEVQLRTDDPRESRVLLSIHGTVILEAALSPALLNFGSMTPGETRSRIVTLAAGPGMPHFVVTGVSSTRNGIGISRKTWGGATVVGAGPGDLLVTVHAPRVPGIYQDAITIRTDLNEIPPLTLPIRTEVVGKLCAIPASLLLSAKFGENATGHIHVYAPSLPTASVESSATALRRARVFVKTITATADDSFDVVIAAQLGESSGLSRDVLHLRAGDSQVDVPVIVLPQQTTHRSFQ
jgi:hypothetical protein